MKQTALANPDRALRRARFLFGDPEGTRGPVHGLMAIWLLVAFLLSPPTAALIIVLVVATETAIQIHRRIYPVLFVAGLVWTAVVGLGTIWGRYTTGWAAMWTWLDGVPEHLGEMGAWWQQTAGPHLIPWLAAQLPAALVIAPIISGWTAAMRRLHTDVWNVPPRRKARWQAFREHLYIHLIKTGRLVTVPRFQIPRDHARRDLKAWLSPFSAAAVLGVDRQFGTLLTLRDVQRVGHLLIVGAAGSGKSETKMRLYQADCKRSRPTFVVDLKGSERDKQRYVETAASYNRPVVSFTLKGGAFMDPFRMGDVSSREDMLIKCHDWRGVLSYFKTATQNFLQAALMVLDATEQSEPYESTLEAILHLAVGDNLLTRAKLVPQKHPDREVITDNIRRLRQYLSHRPDILDGFLQAVGRLVGAQAGRWLRIPAASEENRTEIDGITHVRAHRDAPWTPILDLMQIREMNGVAVFSFNRQADETGTATFGGVMVSAITAMFGIMTERGERRPSSVIVEEFSGLETNGVAAMLAQGRDAGADVTLVTQAIEDVEMAAGQAAAIGQLLSTVATVFAHKVGDGPAAERVSSFAGTHVWIKRRMASDESQALTSTVRGGTTGSGHIDIDPETPRVYRSDIQDLDTGHYVWIQSNPRKIIRRAMTVRDEALLHEIDTSAGADTNDEQNDAFATVQYDDILAFTEGSAVAQETDSEPDAEPSPDSTETIPGHEHLNPGSGDDEEPPLGEPYLLDDDEPPPVEAPPVKKPATGDSGGRGQRQPSTVASNRATPDTSPQKRSNKSGFGRAVPKRQQRNT